MQLHKCAKQSDKSLQDKMYFINNLIITVLILDASCQIARGQYFYGDSSGYQYSRNSPQVVCTSTRPEAGSGRCYYPECKQGEPKCGAGSCNNPILASQRTPTVVQKLPSFSNPVYTPSPPELYIPDYLNKECEPPSSLPVDPVSLALAYSNAQKGCNVREEKLNFGAIRKPFECEVVDTVCNVPEDGLYGFKNQIVELRPSCRRATSPSREAALSYFEDDCDCDCDCDCDISANYPSYRDLGYVPECPTCSTFQPAVPPPSQLPAPPICRNPGKTPTKIGYQQNEDCDCNNEVQNILMRKFSPRFGQ